MIAKYMYIFDYSSCRIIEIELTEEEQNDVSDTMTMKIFDRYHLNEDECAYMFSNKKLYVENLD